jgi:thymidylate kinase
MKIAIIGTHGVGKTTLAYQMVAEAKKRGKNACVIHEVARSCPFPLNDDFNVDGAHWIITSQINRELDAKAQKSDFIVCDRSAYDPICYLEARNFTVQNCIQLEAFAYEWMKTYDHIFYSIPSWQKIVDDGIRSTDIDFQKTVDEQFLYFLSTFPNENVHRIHDYAIFGNNLEEVFKVIFK